MNLVKDVTKQMSIPAQNYEQRKRSAAAWSVFKPSWSEVSFCFFIKQAQSGQRSSKLHTPLQSVHSTAL